MTSVEARQPKRITQKCDVAHIKAYPAIALGRQRLQIANTVLRLAVMVSLVLLAGTTAVSGATASATASVTVAAPAAHVTVSTEALIAAASAGGVTVDQATAAVAIVNNRQKFTLDVVAGREAVRIADSAGATRGPGGQAVAITLHMN